MSNKKKRHAKDIIHDIIKVPHLNWILAIVIIIGAALRFLTWPNVVASDGTIQLKGADAYYFVREAQNASLGGIPNRDMLFCYPDGLITDSNSLLYSYMLSGASQTGLVSLEWATALSGPILAALTALAVALILKDLFPQNDFAVIAGTAIVSLTGIQFIARSYFGFGDRHVLETAVSFFGVWTLIRLYNKVNWKWLVASIFMYFLFVFAWNGAPMVILFFGVGLLIQLFFDEINKKRFIYFIIAFLTLVPMGIITDNSILTVSGLILPAGICFIWLLRLRVSSIKNQLYIVLGLLVAFCVISALFIPSLWNFIVETFKSFLLPDEVSKTISEFQPMFNIYTNFYDLTSKAGIQVLIHLLTAIGVVYMIKRKNYTFAFFTIALLVVSVAKIRGEYYLLIANAVSLAYISADYKKFAYFSFIIAIFFAMLYWSYEVTYNRNSSLVFNDNDYKMAEWIDSNLPQSTSTDNYWIMARWDIGYLYGYIGQRPMFASPNLCNYLTPSYIFTSTNEDEAYNQLKALNAKYLILKYDNFSRYYSESVKLGHTAPEILGGQVDGKVYYLMDSGYYSTLQTRLFNFNGKAFSPGTVYYFSNKNIVSTDNVDEALLKSTNGKAYSINGFISPIKLEALKHFKLIHVEGDGEQAVKLFEIVD